VILHGEGAGEGIDRLNRLGDRDDAVGDGKVGAEALVGPVEPGLP
jgi:hypothetical protein